MNDHDRDLVGAYVLDALSPQEKELYELHLQGCATCRLETFQLAQVVDVLPLADELVEPPAYVRDRIMGAIAEEARSSGETPARNGLTSLAGGMPRERRRPRWGAPQTLLSLAAALIIAVLGVQNIRLQNDVNNRPTATGLSNEVANALAAGAHSYPIPGTSAAPGATATIVQPAQGRAYFVVRGLKPTPSNRIYELWLLKGKVRPRSAGIFRYSGSGPQIVPVPMSSQGYTIAGVTLEACPGGCATPHGAMLLAGKLA